MTKEPKLVACLCCNHRDENMIGVFLRNWKHVNPDIELVLLSDMDNPVKDTYGLEVFNLKWPKGGRKIAPGVAESLLKVAKEKDATHVLKLDADCVHLRREWLDGYEEHHMFGFQHMDYSDAILGGAYGISRDTLTLLFAKNAFPDMEPEDVGMSRAVLRLGRRIKQFNRPDNFRGAFDDKEPDHYQGSTLVHCGQFGHSMRGREKALQWMLRLSDYFGVPELPKPEPKINMLDYFGAAWVLNLDNRPDRNYVFQRRCELAGIGGISRYRAIEGDKSPHPAWWRAGNGAWGCLMSHLRAVQDAQMDGLKNYIVFEDDACFSEDFAERLPRLMDEIDKLGDEWDMLYLGGQHLYVETSPPWPFREGIVRCKNVNRTHAFVVNGRFFNKFAQHIMHAPDYIEKHTPPQHDENGEETVKEWFPHIDHQLGYLHPNIVTLAADPWLCGQAASSSNITGQETPSHWWHDKGWFK